MLLPYNTCTVIFGTDCPLSAFNIAFCPAPLGFVGNGPILMLGLGLGLRLIPALRLGTARTMSPFGLIVSACLI